MRIVRVLVAGAFMAVVSTALPGQDRPATGTSLAQLNGEWNGTLKLDNSSPRVSLVFRVTDSAFAGEVFSDGDRLGAMEDGSFKGNKVHFRVGQFDFTGSIRGTSMTVDLIVFNGSVKTMTLLKAPDANAAPTRPNADVATARHPGLSLAHPVVPGHLLERPDAPPNPRCQCSMRRVAVGAGLAASL